MEGIKKNEMSIESNSKAGNRSDSKQFSSYHSNFNPPKAHSNRNGSMKMTSGQKKHAQKYQNRNDNSSNIQKKHTLVPQFNQLDLQQNSDSNTTHGKIIK